MGSWGVGMQANDTAADAVESFKAQRRTKSKRQVSAAVFLKDLLAEREDSYGTRSKNVLGFAEYMVMGTLAKQMTPDLRKRVNKVIESELKPNNLKLWTDPEERKGALLRFRKVLSGGVSALTADEQKDLSIDGFGLLSNMATHHLTRDEIKKGWK